MNKNQNLLIKPNVFDRNTHNITKIQLNETNMKSQ